MWQKFTERARRVILIGQEEADKLNSGHVGTEHLLLGLVSESQGVASQILQKMGVSLNKVREQISSEAAAGTDCRGDSPKLTLKAKRVLELAADEARRMHHNYIGTEHLLLALLREKDGRAAKVLQAFGLSLEVLRGEGMQYLGDPTETSSHPSTEPFRLRKVEKLKMEQDFLNASKNWAVNEDNYDLATLLRDAVEEVDRRIEMARKEQNTQNEEPKGA